MFPRLKAGSKTSFGAVHSFLLSKFQNSKLHNLNLVSSVPSPLLTLLLVMVIVVFVITTV
jgi:hypothetical protein